MSNNPHKKIGIVTGSTKGIGKGIAIALAKQNITVVVTSRETNRAREVADEIIKTGGQSLGLKFNLEERGDLKPLIDNAIDAYGRLDVLVNNAMSAECALPWEALSDEQIESALISNITNVVLLTKFAYPHLKENRGNVINIGSVIANKHLLGLPIYGIVKGALLQMTKVFAAEWATEGIRVNAINPGFIRTQAFSDMGMPNDLIEKSYQFYKSYHPLGNIGEPEDIGKIAAFLASDAARLMTGSIIDVDGGYSVQGLPLYSV